MLKLIAKGMQDINKTICIYPSNNDIVTLVKLGTSTLSQNNKLSQLRIINKVIGEQTFFSGNNKKLRGTSFEKP